MTRRRLFLAAIGLLAAAGVCLPFWLAAAADPLAVAFERIEIGMPTEEALAVVGRPIESGGYEVRVAEGDDRPLDFAEWWENDYKLEVYSWEGRVAAKTYGSVYGSFRRHLLHKLGLL